MALQVPLTKYFLGGEFLHESEKEYRSWENLKHQYQATN
jgi:hypothetical protein